MGYTVRGCEGEVTSSRRDCGRSLKEADPELRTEDGDDLKMWDRWEEHSICKRLDEDWDFKKESRVGGA